MGAKTNKAEYFEKLKGLLETYTSIFIVTVDNVSSQQMHEIRASLRGQGVVLMGKNTMVRRAIRVLLSDFPEYERLLPHVKGNVGFVFTNADLNDSPPPLVPAPSLLSMSLSRRATPVWNPERPLSSRLSVFPPRLLVVPLKLLPTSSSLRLETRSELLKRPFSIC
ncbi:unnamed protein product [Tuber melanosporum]|uniref:(Perigord truffle) hypothetical protein n=1 Tax=Tuber melanosporum (strain Mel28) TaxID=656061 RepID=D5GNA0_TUBMM|nr:uncharacterized protein GSTUM_00011189001 [Tuber melanosporum]CAZ85993.1 unnamed protein product [Tuber melanosporum]